MGFTTDPEDALYEGAMGLYDRTLAGNDFDDFPRNICVYLHGDRTPPNYDLAGHLRD
jgi:hypothetical protein